MYATRSAEEEIHTIHWTTGSPDFESKIALKPPGA